MLEQAQHKKMLKHSMQRPAPAPGQPFGFAGAPAFGAAVQAAAMPAAACFGDQMQTHAFLFGQFAPAPVSAVRVPQAPVLGFIKHPAVVLAGLEPDMDGSLVVPAEMLQQLLQEAPAAAAGPAAAGAGAGTGPKPEEGAETSSVLGVGGFSVVYVAAFDLQQPGQFASCFAPIQGGTAAEAAALPEGRRDLGLAAGVDNDAISALVSWADCRCVAMLSFQVRVSRSVLHM